jgi:sugar phosphate isomerase/epimerase
MISRRNFLKRTAGAGFAGLAVLGTGCSDAAMQAGTAVGSRRLPAIGLQLYTVRNLLREDFEGTMEQVAAVGYDQVEFAGYYDRSPDQVRTLINRLNLDPVATHVGYNQVRDNLDEVLATSQTIGIKTIVVPSLPGDIRQYIDGYRTVAEVLNAAGARSREMGIGMGYHNHAFEFDPIDGQIPYDVLLNETDPDLVTMEVDLFWMVRGGHDPLDYFARYPGRFGLSHVKDMTADGDMVAVGEGQMDFAAIFAQSDQSGMQYYIVEHDNPDDPMVSIRTSYQYLDQLTY